VKMTPKLERKMKEYLSESLQAMSEALKVSIRVSGRTAKLLEEPVTQTPPMQTDLSNHWYQSPDVCVWEARRGCCQRAAPEKFESERFCSDKRINRRCALVNFCSSFFLETPRCGLSNSTFLMRPFPP